MSRELVVHSASSAPSEAWRGLTAHQRLARISGRFVYTSPIKELLRAFRLQIDALPTGSSKRGIILSGPDGIGKTALVREFARNYPKIDGDGRDRRDVIVTVPTFKVDAASLADAVVREINWPVRGSRQLGARSPEQQMDWVFEQAQTAMLFITRADFLAPNGKEIAPEAVPFLVRLLDQAGPTLALVGSKNFRDLVTKHPKLVGKFRYLELGPLSYGKRWLKAVAQYDAELPFLPGGLTATGMPEMLYLATEGRLPLLSGLCQDAGELALFGAKKADRLSKGHFEIAFPVFRPGLGNPFIGDRKVPTLITEINRKAGVTLENLVPDAEED